MTFCPESSCTYNGNNGSVFGRLNTISTILVDGKDNVWIPNIPSNGSFSFVLIPGGNPAEAASLCQTGCTYTSSNYGGMNVVGYTTDSSGNLWVANYSNSTYLLLKIPASSPDSPTQYLCSSSCGFSSSYGNTFMTVDSSQNIWVTSSNVILTKISVSAIGSSFLGTQICSSSICGGVNFSSFSPTGIGVDSSGNVWVSGITNGSFGNGGTVFENPSGNTTSSGVKTLCNSNQSGCTHTAPSGEMNFTTHYNSPGTFNTQTSNNLAVDSSGDVWLSQYGNNGAIEIPSGNIANPLYCSNGCGNGAALGGGGSPAGIAVDSKGRSWIAGTFSNSLSNSNSTSTPSSSTVSPYSGGGISAQAASGSIIASYASYCDFTVIKTNLMGCTQFTAFMFPQAVAVDSKGNVWVANNGFDNASVSTNNNNNGNNNNGTVTGWVTELIGAAK